MKIHGKKLGGPRIEVVVLPRPEGTDDLVFKAQAVLNYDDFDALYPEPNPPAILKPGGVETLDINDKKYLVELSKYAEAKTQWLILKSLEATPGLEWETIDWKKPGTWGNYAKELQDAGVSQLEITKILGIFQDANGLSQVKIEEATKRFLAGEAATRKEQSSRGSEQKSTQSGEPAKDSVSDLKK